jgi:hypothetical protein
MSGKRKRGSLFCRWIGGAAHGAQHVQRRAGATAGASCGARACAAGAHGGEEERGWRGAGASRLLEAWFKISWFSLVLVPDGVTPHLSLQAYYKELHTTAKAEDMREQELMRAKMSLAYRTGDHREAARLAERLKPDELPPAGK